VRPRLLPEKVIREGAGEVPDAVLAPLAARFLKAAG
jgi:hypothetical protein